VTVDDLAAAMPQYIAGIEAELALLRQLLQLAESQRDASQNRNLAEVNRAGDARDRIMAALVQLEHELKPIRLEFVKQQAEAEQLDGFDSVLALHRTAASLVSEVLQADRNTLAELRTAEAARRTSAQTIETGEATLAAYRRVLMPVGSTGLVDRQG
jgi:hypothetical protein